MHCPAKKEDALNVDEHQLMVVDYFFIFFKGVTKWFTNSLPPGELLKRMTKRYPKFHNNEIHAH